MPTKTKEYSLYQPGRLVKTRQDIYSVSPHVRIPAGTVGIIISGPRQNYKNHFQVNFVGQSEPWWVNPNEIEPHWESFNLG